jgi:hypothetical protein
MNRNIPMHRVSMAALVAAIAASSTPLAAQSAEPTQAVPDQATDTAATVAPNADPAPVTETPVAKSSTTAETSTDVPVAAHAKAAAPVKKPVAKLTQKSAPVPTATAIASTPAPAAEPLPEALPAPTTESLQSAAVAQSIPTAPDTLKSDVDTDTVAFGGALALLILGAGAFGLSRRRKSVENPEITPVRHEVPAIPVVRREAELSPAYITPPVRERSAFSWGRSDADRATLTPIERAQRGPTSDNPSVSLKKRLKRAAFFEQRERDAAAGRAVSVSRWAGLPDRLVDSAKTAMAPRRQLQPV